MFSICVGSLASLKNSASFLRFFLSAKWCQMVTRHMFLPCARALFTLVTWSWTFIKYFKRSRGDTNVPDG
jgi:hypothetical protein